MAMDLYSENSNPHNNNITMSPRISFSHDLSQPDTIPVVELQLLRTLSSSDFNFCVQQNNVDHHQHADELFSNGKIIPTDVKQQKRATQNPLPPPPPQMNHQNHPPHDHVEQHNSSSKSYFWGFKRSSSCGNGYAGSICPIPLLSRSNSTGSSTSGSTSSTKRSSSSSKEGLITQKHHHHHNYQKPPLRKTSYYGNNNGNASNGVRVNPVLNLGFGSLFSSSKKK